MSEWRETELGSGLSVRHGFAFKGEFFNEMEGPYIVLTPGNFHDGGGFKEKSGKEKFYDGPVPDSFLLRAGDIIVAMTEQSYGLLGSTATIPEDDRYLHNQRIGLIDVHDRQLLSERFVYHLMNAPVVRHQIQATATGSKVRHTAPNRICALRAKLPSVGTQSVIADILDSIDNLIENNRQRIEVLEEMAQAIYREWFVHFRYPGHEDATFVDSPLGPIPEGWKISELRQMAHVNAESRKPSADETIRYLDISCLGDRTLSTPHELNGATAPGRARRCVQPGDVVWSMVRPNRRAHALLMEPGEDWIASTGLAVLTARSVSSAFLFESVSSPKFSDYLVSQEGGSAYPAVKPIDFETALITRPYPEIDLKFETVTRPLHHEAWTLRVESDSLGGLRDLLLPKLVTGEIDVSALDLDVVVEAAS